MKRELEFHADALPAHVNPDDEADRLPINYVQLAIRHKWWLVCGLVAGAILGHLAYSKSGPEYEAVAQILVARKYTPPMRESERMLQDTGKPSEHIPIILSPMIAARAIKIGSLQDLPTFRGEPDLVECVLDGLKVKRTSGQDRSHFSVLEIRYSSRIPADARKVVEAVVDAYGQYLVEQSKEHSNEVLALAQKTANDLLEKIHQREQNYHDFLETVPTEFRAALGHKTANAASTNTAPEEVIATLGEERNKNSIRMAELKSRQKSIQEALAAGEPRESIEQEVRRFMSADGRNERTTRSTEIGVYQSQLIPLLLKEQDLSREFGKDHPDLVSVRESIAKIVATYQKLGVQLPEGVTIPGQAQKSFDYISIYLDTVRRQMKEVELKDQELEGMIQREGARAREFAGFRATDQNLRAELTQLQEQWRKRLDREGEVTVEKDSNGYSMKVLAPVKDALVLKRLMKFYAGGSMFGMMLVAVIFLVKELKDFTLKDIRDVRVTLRQPVLGSVVAFEPVGDNGRTNQPHPALRYLFAPHSVEAEDYRSVRTALFVTAEQHGARSILISSPEPGDGKTTLACNLAISMAQSGKRVLLVDGDLRRPNVHNLFRVPLDVGLTDVLMGEVDALTVVRPTTIQGLSLVTAGQIPENPAELLTSPRLQQAIRDLMDEFDYVFVDAPPLLAVSDPCILARQTDGLLIVTRINKNTRAAVIRVRQLIQDQGIRVLGVVANGAIYSKGRGYSDYGTYLSAQKSAEGSVRDHAPESVGSV